MAKIVPVCISVLIIIGVGCGGDDDGANGGSGDGGAGAEAGVSGGTGGQPSDGGGSGGQPSNGGGSGGTETGGTGGGSAGGSGEAGSPSGGVDGGSETDSGVEPEPVEIIDGIPDTEYCQPVSSWDPAWAAFEEEVIDLINQRRAQGADCGAEGSFASADPVQMNPFLRCSARLHSTDMAQQGYFESQGPDGRTFMERINDAGYTGVNYSENIGTNYASPTALITGLMNSDGVCANLMNPAFGDAGIGFYEPENADGSTYATSRMWTIDLADSGSTL